ncbi:hypothetical protein HK405_011039 [Cladochytrium tenue]|nr:hypothetical protein HK405_011039 [Cladochytrium tenue]
MTATTAMDTTRAPDAVLLRSVIANAADPTSAAGWSAVFAADPTAPLARRRPMKHYLGPAARVDRRRRDPPTDQSHPLLLDDNAFARSHALSLIHDTAYRDVGATADAAAASQGSVAHAAPAPLQSGLLPLVLYLFDQEYLLARRRGGEIRPELSLAVFLLAAFRRPALLPLVMLAKLLSFDADRQLDAHAVYACLMPADDAGYGGGDGAGDGGVDGGSAADHSRGRDLPLLLQSYVDHGDLATALSSPTIRDSASWAAYVAWIEEQQLGGGDGTGHDGRTTDSVQVTAPAEAADRVRQACLDRVERDRASGWASQTAVAAWLATRARPGSWEGVLFY